MPRINGNRGAYLQPARYGRNDQGDYTLWDYEGTKNECLALVANAQALGATWELQESFSGAKCRFTAKYAVNVATGQTEQPVNQWEFFAGKIEKDLLETDTAYVQSIPRDDKIEIRRSIGACDSPKAFANQAGVDIYNLMLGGTRARVQFVPTLKHTQTVSNNWTVKAALTNVGRIISPGSIVSLEAIPNTILFNLPNDLSNTSGLVYGWLKMHPTVRVAANLKNGIEQEWIYNLWSTVLYGAPL